MDNVNHPSHYETGKFESIDVMIETQGKEAVQDFCVCNAFKYIYRHRFKNGLEDIRKAIWYLDKYVELELDNEQKTPVFVTGLSKEDDNPVPNYTTAWASSDGKAQITTHINPSNPINEIKICGETVLNMDVDNGWTITDVWFDHDTPVELIDCIKVKFEKV